MIVFPRIDEIFRVDRSLVKQLLLINLGFKAYKWPPIIMAPNMIDLVK
jgi:hypothetical protein